MSFIELIRIDKSDFLTHFHRKFPAHGNALVLEKNLVSAPKQIRTEI